MDRSTGHDPDQEYRNVPKNIAFEEGPLADCPQLVQTPESELEDARTRIRDAIDGLDSATKLYVAVSALIGKDSRSEIAVTNPVTGDVMCYITPAAMKYARDAGSRVYRRGDSAKGESSLDQVLSKVKCIQETWGKEAARHEQNEP
jgi:hypothetical protein